MSESNRVQETQYFTVVFAIRDKDSFAAQIGDRLHSFNESVNPSMADGPFSVIGTSLTNEIARIEIIEQAVQQQRDLDYELETVLEEVFSAQRIEPDETINTFITKHLDDEPTAILEA